MDTSTTVVFPETLPDVHIDVLEETTEHEVVCDELQWWFVVPRAGETSAARWYDRASGQVTMMRETSHPVMPFDDGSGRVRIRIDESTFPADGRGSDQRCVEFTARLSSAAAEFRSVEMDGHVTGPDDDGFDEAWGRSRGRVLRDGRRLVRTGPREYSSLCHEGIRADLVAVSIGGITRRALRVLDLEVGEEPDEIGQPVIDLDTGRTLVYWQYRPEDWDADAESWLSAHPEEGMVIDGVRYQRRNCTGRDTVALTDHAVRLFGL